MSTRVTCRKLIGRELELAGLRTALERAAHGTPVTVFVSGEAGVGKTRLVREFFDRVLDGDTHVWSGSCAPLA
jgi:predicted ATPase